MIATTTIPELGVDRALELLDAVVDDLGPDHVATCSYVSPDARRGGRLVPRCIVGQVLARHGVPLQTLDSYNLYENDYGYKDGALPKLREAGVVDYLTDAAYEALNEAQIYQDAGYLWGDAQAAAHQVAGR